MAVALLAATTTGQIEAFLAADSLAKRREAAARIVESGAPFDAVLAGLRHGRAYASDVPRGKILRTRKGSDGRTYPYMILVPADYTPERRWPVRFDLHGGMGAPEWKEIDGSWSGGWSIAQGQIMVFPAGWVDAMWWHRGQVENFEAILRELRAEYNIDENRAVLAGNSDGGAALFFHAMRAPDRYAGYAGHVAPPDRLTRAAFGPDGQMHVANLRDQSFHLGYGGKDPLVPWVYARRYLELFEKAGARIDWYVLEDRGHSLHLSDERVRQFTDFIAKARRDPLPARLYWATEGTRRYARRSWLVIERLRTPRPGEAVDTEALLPRWGTPIQLRGPSVEPRHWGSVELERRGNRVIARTHRVERFSLLLSPDAFDLSSPIRVEVDGRVAFEGRVAPSVETLLEWAALDDDRTRLFAAKLTIDVP